DVLLLAAELGGVAIALQLLTGLSPRLFAVPIALVVWLLLWKGTFSFIEDGVGLLGLVTLCFVAAAWLLGPDGSEVASGFVPRLAGSERLRYGALAVGILGATISPYLLNFYSSGAVEEDWTEKAVGPNRVV